MPARGTATNRQVAVNRQIAVGRLAASNRQGTSGVVDDMTFLDEQIVSAASAANLTFSAISGAYRHLQIIWKSRSFDQASATEMQLQMNGDTAGNYDRETIQANDTTVSGDGVRAASIIRIGRVCGTGAPADAFSSGSALIIYYATTIQDKIVIASHFNIDSIGADSGIFLNSFGGAWRTANAAITSIVLTPSAGSFIQNSSACLYGIT